MSYNFEGKVALVTGAAQGIGRTTALTLAKYGADVLVADLNLEGAEATVSEIRKFGRRAQAYRMNVADYDEVQNVIHEMKSDTGTSISLLVNNAAKMNTMAQMKDMTKQMWDVDLSINLTGAFHVSKAVWNDMIAQNYGCIVNMSSIAGLMGGFGQVVYSSAKAGILGFTKSLALEGARHHIRVNCIAPSFLATPAWNIIPPDYQKRMEQRVPLRRVGDPQEAAELIAFLMSDRADYITGQCIPITGGADLFVF